MIGNIRNMKNITGLLSPISKKLEKEIYNINKSFQLDRQVKRRLDTTTLHNINMSIIEVAKDLEREFYNLDKQLQIKNKIIVSHELEKRNKQGSRGSYEYFDIYNR